MKSTVSLENIDKVTDVISFALDDSDDDFESMKSIMEEDDSFVTSIGDIVISLDRAKEQAEDYGHSLERELGFFSTAWLLALKRL